MTTTEAGIDGGHSAPLLEIRDIVGDPVSRAAVDADPRYAGTVDLDVEEAIMQEISRTCIGVACSVRQQEKARELAPMAAPGGRISPEHAGRLILERLKCPLLRPEHRSRVRLEPGA